MPQQQLWTFLLNHLYFPKLHTHLKFCYHTSPEGASELLLRMWLLIINLTSLYLQKRVLQYSLDLRLQRDRLPRNIEPALANTVGLQQTLPLPKQCWCTDWRIVQLPRLRQAEQLRIQKAFKQTATTQKANKGSFEGNAVKVKVSKKCFR